MDVQPLRRASIFFIIFLLISVYPIQPSKAAPIAVTQKYTVNTPSAFFNGTPQPNNTATYHFRPIGNINYGVTNNTSGANLGNLSLTLPFITTGVNVNTTAFWYPITGIIGLATVSAFIYFFKQTDTINGKVYPLPNMKVKIEGTTTANANITILFRNLHVISVLRQIRDCEFRFESVGFSWCDTATTTVFNPAFNATVLSVTFVVPAGTFKIDPTTIGTASAGTATGINPQRKVFFCQTRYWAFYSDGTNIVWRTSTDGTTWTSSTTVRAIGSTMSFWNDCTNTKMYYVNQDASGFEHRAATLNTDGTLTYDYAEVTVTALHTSATTGRPSITKDTSAILWIALDTKVSTTSTHIEVWKCTISGTNCGTAGNWANSLDVTTSSSGATNVEPPSIVPLTSGKLMLVYPKGIVVTQQMGIRTYSGTTWNAEVLTTSSFTNTDYGLVAISDTGHFAGVKSGGTVVYWNCAYACASAPTESTISSATTNDNTVISSDNNQEIIVSYVTSGASTSIFYKLSTNGGTSFGSETTLISGESVSTTIATLSITYTKQNSCYEFLWTSNSGFNIRFTCLLTTAIQRAITDTFTFTDSVTRLLLFARTISNTYTFTESVARALLFTKAITDTFTFLESVLNNVLLPRAITDTFGFTDLAAKGIFKSISDTFGFTDFVQVTLPKIRQGVSSGLLLDLPLLATILVVMLGFVVIIVRRRKLEQ